MASVHMIFSPAFPIKILKWKVKNGTRVFKGTLLGLYEAVENESSQGQDAKRSIQKFKALSNGIVQDILFQPGEVIKPGSVVITVELETLGKCAHATVMKNMCADCGKDLMSEHGSEFDRESMAASVAMVHNIPELFVSENQAKQLGREDVQSLLKSRKLVLLVDLDETLIHTTTNPSVPADIPDVCHFQIWEGGHAVWCHTKLRPHTTTFLQSMLSLYQLHICTFGNRIYAHTVARLLDPDEKIFSHRILSRDECFDPGSKTANLKALFPCGDGMVCIIDDRADVWNSAPNMVRVKPYRFFRGTGDINAPPGREAVDMKGQPSNESAPDSTDDEDSKDSDSEQAVDKVDVADAKSETSPFFEDSDDYLLHLEDILKRIHSAYYSMLDQKLVVTSPEALDQESLPDLKCVIPYIKRKTLKGCFVVFSGLVPLNSNPERSRAYIAARSLGAVVQEEITGFDQADQIERTTHLVAVKPGTKKHKLAQKMADLYIVSDAWLWACEDRWERCDEVLFPLLRL